MLRKVLMSILTFLPAFSAFADEEDNRWNQEYGIRCVTEAAPILGLPSEIVLDISACPDFETVKTDVRNTLLGRSGYQFEWFALDTGTLESALTLLSTDHEESGGSGPYSDASIETIESWYATEAASKEVFEGEFADSYQSGTGVTGLVALKTADGQKLILLSKFTYAE